MTGNGVKPREKRGGIGAKCYNAVDPVLLSAIRGTLLMSAPHPRVRSQDILLSAIVLIVVIGGLLFMMTYVQRDRHSPWGRDVVEINQLDMAFKYFKERFGEYPPDFGEQTNEQRVATVKKFLSKAFPKCPEANYPVEFRDPAKFDPQEYNPATALVFWLGGTRDAEGRLIGFSADPQKPFDRTVPSRISPSFDFEPQRLSSDGGMKYYPPSYRGDRSQGCYVYFRAESGSYAGKTYADAGNSGAMRDAQHSTDKKVEYMNPKSFQIRSFGLDGRWGATPQTRWGVMFPSGSDYNPENLDDLGNFCSGRFEDSIP
jgi:hypothetical protein